MKTVKINFTSEEKNMVNNLLLNNAIGFSKLLDSLEGSSGHEQASGMLGATIAAQQMFFAATVQGSEDYPESVAMFCKRILEDGLEGLRGSKEELIREGSPYGFQIAETEKVIESAMQKIPEPSLIQTS